AVRRGGVDEEDGEGDDEEEEGEEREHAGEREGAGDVAEALALPVARHFDREVAEPPRSGPPAHRLHSFDRMVRGRLVVQVRPGPALELHPRTDADGDRPAPPKAERSRGASY